MLKQQKGITLVALVITIVVLIILAGVAISLTLSDNGIFNRAREGANEYKTEQTKELTMLNELDTQINEIMATN